MRNTYRENKTAPRRLRMDCTSWVVPCTLQSPDKHTQTVSVKLSQSNRHQRNHVATSTGTDTVPVPAPANRRCRSEAVAVPREATSAGTRLPVVQKHHQMYARKLAPAVPVHDPIDIYIFTQSSSRKTRRRDEIQKPGRPPHQSVHA